jgi:DNA polymerase-1
MKEEERQAFNAAIQGTAADIMKHAMINVYKKLQDNKLCTQVILQVHDELVLEVPRDEIEAVKALVVHEMSNATELKVPLKVDIGVGENWLIAG